MLEDKVPATVDETMAFAVDSLFPTIFRLLQLVATWPVTSNSCERSISALRWLKTYLHSTRLQQCLCGLALLHTHYSMQLYQEVIIKCFLQLRPRAIIAPDIFGSAEAESVSSESDSDPENLSE